MPSACVRVLPRPPYHGDKMISAFRRMGYKIFSTPSQEPNPGDVIVTWNRYPRDEQFVRPYERAGGKVIVVENGYFGRGEPGDEWYAMGVGQHNGCGTTPAPSPKRWDRLGIELKPWRTDGQEIVLLGTRGMGSDVTREPNNWLRNLSHALRRQTKRQVRVRQHPGPQWVVPKVSLEDDLANAWAAVTWGSSAGLKALALGTPVFHGLPGWIGKRAARTVRHLTTEDRFLGDREQMFHHVAAALWSLDEIENGKAFRCLLSA